MRNSLKLLAVPLLAFSLFAVSPLLAAETANGPAVTASQPTNLATFLENLKTGDQGSANQSLMPAPENKIITCQYSACPTGQTCWYCHNAWVCLWNYPDPTQVPPGCSGGPL
jgi:hypothetical protein